MEHLLAAKGQKLSSERGGSVTGPHDLVEFSTKWVLGAQAVQRKLGLAADDHEHVVKVVSHTSSQARNGLHFLGVAQHFLGMFALGNLPFQLVVGSRQFQSPKPCRFRSISSYCNPSSHYQSTNEGYLW